MFTDYAITKKNAGRFPGLIPQFYMPEIEQEKLFGNLTVNTLDKETPVVGMTLYRQIGEDLEIEWVSLTNAYNSPVYGRDLTRRLYLAAVLSGGCNSVFARFDEQERMSAYFPEDYWELTREKSNVFHFRLADVRGLDDKVGGNRLKNCIPLKNTDHKMQNDLLTGARTQREPVPLPSPVRWDVYDQELSAFYAENDSVTGCILVSFEGEKLVIRLLYSQNPIAAAALLAYAHGAALKRFSEIMPVICPVVNEVSEQLVMKLVENPVRGELICARRLLPLSDENLKAPALSGQTAVEKED